MPRQAAMRRKGSFMDDLPPEPMGAEVGGMGESPMDISLDEYVPGYDDEMAMGEEAPMEEPMDMEMRIASLEDRIAQLEAMLAG